jgi:hypothetical protein
MTSAMPLAFHSYPSAQLGRTGSSRSANAENTARRQAFTRYLAGTCAVPDGDAELALVAVRLVQSLAAGTQSEAPIWVQDRTGELVDRLQTGILGLQIDGEEWPDELQTSDQANRLARLLRRDRGLAFILDTVLQHSGQGAVQLLLSVPYDIARLMALAARAGGVC